MYHIVFQCTTINDDRQYRLPPCSQSHFWLRDTIVPVAFGYVTGILIQVQYWQRLSPGGAFGDVRSLIKEAELSSLSLETNQLLNKSPFKAVTK